MQVRGILLCHLVFIYVYTDMTHFYANCCRYKCYLDIMFVCIIFIGMNRISLYPISSYQMNSCVEFAVSSVESSKDHYASRNQFDVDKIKNDIYLGKVAEYAVYNHYYQNFGKISKPDVKVYRGKDKSYDADLKTKKSLVHVKSYFSKSSYPPSWVFQKSDPLVHSPKENDVIILCIVDETGKGKGYVGDATTLQEYYKPLRKASLDSKTAIYLNDLMHLYVK